MDATKIALKDLKLTPAAVEKNPQLTTPPSEHSWSGEVPTSRHHHPPQALERWGHQLGTFQQGRHGRQGKFFMHNPRQHHIYLNVIPVYLSTQMRVDSSLPSA